MQAQLIETFENDLRLNKGGDYYQHAFVKRFIPYKEIASNNYDDTACFEVFSYKDLLKNVTVVNYTINQISKSDDNDNIVSIEISKYGVMSSKFGLSEGDVMIYDPTREHEGTYDLVLSTSNDFNLVVIDDVLKLKTTVPFIREIDGKYYSGTDFEDEIDTNSSEHSINDYIELSGTVEGQSLLGINVILQCLIKK